MDSVETIKNDLIEIAQSATEIGQRANELYDKGIEQGKQVEYDAFWDSFQQNGNRTQYEYAFYVGWDDNNFKPKYDICPINASSMIRNNTIKNGLKNMAERGLTIDLSNAEYCSYAFYNCQLIEEIPFNISLENMTGNPSKMFDNCYKLHTIKKIIFPSYENYKMTNTSDMFNYVPKLTNLTVEGDICTSINLSYCPNLTAESAKNIIEHLKDLWLTETQFTETIKLHEDVWARLETEYPLSDGENWKDCRVPQAGWNT